MYKNVLVTIALLGCMIMMSGCGPMDTAPSFDAGRTESVDRKETLPAEKEESMANPLEESMANSVEESMENPVEESTANPLEESIALSEGEEKDLLIEESSVYDEDRIEEAFYSSEITDEIFARIYGNSYKENCTVPREELRYVHVLHVGFDGETKEGELICNQVIAEKLLEIFRELYTMGYEIEKIRLVDEYEADDETSMRDNNSSCFNFRFISHTTTVSKHGLGLAIDINPLYNPYIKTVNGERIIEPETAEEYVDRDRDFPHKITQEDAAYQLFTAQGFEWGGAWNRSKDYQHFEYNGI